jgi:chromosome segregation protein
MLLKRVVLDGFKSFADRTEFEFGPGMSAIVGPNGCGKSNVLDAVRWVLGEQSARTLRGACMLDVIFAGSRTRKPATYAEVQLTFDNASGLLATEEREVTVGRSLLSNGESEYRLNGNICRLKDIRGLFLDTGIGVDAYSVIEQGRVDALLQANPLERREIFEEAAGISRYKLRRTEAQRKLERTQANLLRLSDVLEELEKRLRSVKLAAGKARSFQEHDARLRELRATFSLAEYDGLERTRRRLASRVAALDDVLHARRAALARRDAQSAELGQRLATIENDLQAAEAERVARQTECSALGERIAQGQRRLRELHEARERLLAQADDACQRAAQVAARIDADESGLARLVEVERAQADAAESLRGATSGTSQRGTELRRLLEHEKTAAFEHVRQITLLGNQQSNLEQQLERLERQATALQERSMQTSNERNQWRLSLTELGERAQALEQQCAALTRTLEDLEHRCAARTAELTALDEQVGVDKQARSGLLSRISLLEDMERRREGVDQATRWMLERARDGTGTVIGLVGDVLSVDDPRVACLQAVLSRFENYALVSDGYAFLSELNRGEPPPGSLAVIALDRLPSGPGPARYSDAPGFVASALDWVRCAPEYRRLAETLLAGVVLVDSLERALALADGAPEGYTFVTLEGHSVTGGGCMLLGGALAPPGPISRKAERRQLLSERDEVESRLERLARERVEWERARDDLALEREGLMQQVAQAQRQHADACGQRLRIEDELRRTERESTSLERELHELSRTVTAVTEQIGRVKLERAVSEEAQRGHEARIGSLERDLAAIEQSRAALAGELTQALVEAARASERRASAEQALHALRSERGRLMSESEQCRQQADESVRRTEQAQDELEASDMRRRELLEESRHAEATAGALREKRQAQRRHLEACNAAVRQHLREIQEVEGVLREKEVSLREAEVRTEGLLARVRDELALDLAALHGSYRSEERDWEAIREEIEGLRQKIARLGHVNLDALTELEELTPRYDNLAAQRQDLVDSVARLERLIAELDAESRARFTHSFATIREHFQELFRKVFGGGKADVVLEDPENPLECGIEIVARPPGKEPQSISLLSGGEKTMTAIALLLAVFRSRPSPFTILDEVDAALDEANVERFNNVLDEFVRNSQFVVITHNKRTMQCADVLYGVTMDEPGVSKRVAVRLDRVNTPAVA